MRVLYFIETKSSFPTDRKFQGDLTSPCTESPWIYYELQIVQLLLDQKERFLTEISMESLDPTARMHCLYDVRRILNRMDLVQRIDDLPNKLKELKLKE